MFLCQSAAVSLQMEASLRRWHLKIHLGFFFLFFFLSLQVTVKCKRRPSACTRGQLNVLRLPRVILLNRVMRNAKRQWKLNFVGINLLLIWCNPSNEMMPIKRRLRQNGFTLKCWGGEGWRSASYGPLWTMWLVLSCANHANLCPSIFFGFLFVNCSEHNQTPICFSEDAVKTFILLPPVSWQ